MNLEHVRYDLSHGFPDDWATSQLERDIIEKMCRDQQFDLVVNATWGFLECPHPINNEAKPDLNVTIVLHILIYFVRMAHNSDSKLA